MRHPDHPDLCAGSWWFGDTTGLARRDFELGAFAWVGEADPNGRTLYACDQIPLPSNNWEGQNSMGWCNQTASDAIVKANNTLIRDERIAAYDIFQKEFAKDVVSIPLFQRAEAEAWTANLEGVMTRTRPSTPRPTCSEWKLTDGGDTIVIGMTQEPDTMLALVSSMAAQRLVDRPDGDGLISTRSTTMTTSRCCRMSWPRSRTACPEQRCRGQGRRHGLRCDGSPVPLEKDVEVFDKDGNEVDVRRRDARCTMKQLVATYKFKPYTWNDGTPGSVADFELGS